MKATLLTSVVCGCLVFAAGCSDDDDTCNCGAGMVCNAQGQCVPESQDGGNGDQDMGTAADQSAPTDDQSAPTDDLGGSTEGYLSDACPATGTAITATVTTSGNTTIQGIGEHCMSVADPYFQAAKISLSAETKVVVTVTTTESTPVVVSLRDQCEVNHGCQLGSGTINYERTLPAGDYNLIIATDSPTAFDLTVDFQAPEA